MTIEVAVAHAIHLDLDIVQAMPNVNDIPVEQMEGRINQFVATTQEKLSRVIREYGWQFLEKQDAKGLCRLLRKAGIRFPQEMLLRICERIIELYALDVFCEWELPNGSPVFSMRLTVDLSNGSEKAAASRTPRP